MATFEYSARTAGGDKKQGSLEADDRRAALFQLERSGVIPISVVEGAAAKKKATKEKSARGASPFGGRRKMKTRDILDFTTELSDLLAAGMKLSTALGTMASRRSGTEADEIIRSLHEEINRGTSLSDAMAQHPRVFGRLYVNLIRAGEASGALSEILERLAEHLERVQDTKEKVVMALVYPSFILVAGVITIVFTMMFVIPRFSKIFQDLGSTLPLPTRMLIGISNAIIDYWWGFLIVVIVGIFAAMQGLKTQRGREWWDGMQLRLPLVKGIISSSAYSQFARTLQTLMGNGVHVLQALTIVEQTMDNSVIAGEIRNARERVTDGTSISGPLSAGNVFPPLLTDMLHVGEQNGDMPGALGHIARRYENELDRRVKILMTAIEPILIFAIAVVVGFVAISMLLAVFDMTSGLNI